MNKFLLLSILAISVISCSPHINSDDEVPAIENLEIVNLDSVDNVRFFIGTNIKFSANFIDNQELGSYKFDIHFAGDGHKHPNDYEENLTSNTNDWSFTRNGKLNGTEHTVSFENKIVLRDDKGVEKEDEPNAGPYHCIVYAVDAAGNSAPFAHSSFLVANEDMPTYTITEPDFSDYSIGVGETMNLKGLAYGRRGLSKLAYIIRSVDDLTEDDLLNNSEVITGDVKEITIDTPIVIPSDATAGNYALLLLASDQVGNVGQYLAVFKITN